MVTDTARFAIDVPKITVESVDFGAINDIQPQFEMFDRKNPQVYDALVHMVRQMKARGYKTGSMKIVYSLLRLVNTSNLHKSSGGFGLPEAFTSRYARKIMSFESDLDGFFKKCQLRSGSDPDLRSQGVEQMVIWQ